MSSVVKTVSRFKQLADPVGSLVKPQNQEAACEVLEVCHNGVWVKDLSSQVVFFRFKDGYFRRAVRH